MVLDTERNFHLLQKFCRIQLYPLVLCIAEWNSFIKSEHYYTIHTFWPSQLHINSICILADETSNTGVPYIYLNMSPTLCV